MTPITDLIRQKLSTVEEPELHKDIMSLGMVKRVSFQDGLAFVLLELTTPACPMKDEIKNRIEVALKTLSEVTKVDVEFTSSVQAARPVTGKSEIPGVKNIIAVYACKGGVGKSTISTNLSVALVKMGARVGLLDADVHGPNIPLMMGVDAKPHVSDDNRITPLMAHGVSVMSLGLLKDAKLPFIWRGPMVHGAIQQLLRDTVWGELDYLIVDLPPGTGDAQLTVIQSVPLAGVLFVTTPQAVSLADSVKGINMFKKLNVPLLGLVENMSGFSCPECHHVTPIFSKGGGEKEAQEFGIPFVGAIPLDPQIVQGGDSGKPVVVTHPDSDSAQSLQKMASKIAANVSVLHFQDKEPIKLGAPV